VRNDIAALLAFVDFCVGVAQYVSRVQTWPVPAVRRQLKTLLDDTDDLQVKESGLRPSTRGAYGASCAAQCGVAVYLERKPA
jgi:hypothetical protein